MDIGEQLTLLAELSHVEQKLKAAQDHLERLHAEAKQADADATEQLARAEQLEQKHTEHELKRRSMESDLAAEKDKLRKWQARADQIRGEREAAALGSEIGAQKRSITHLENDILEKMQEVEDAGIAWKVAQEAVAAAKKRQQDEWSKIKDDLDAAKADVAQHDKARSALVGKLPAPLVKRYEKIAQRRGFAVAIIKGETCGACKVSLPPQLCIQIHRGQVLETCPVCQRILVHEAMTRAPDEETESSPEGASA